MKILTDESGQKWEVTDRKDIKFYGASDYTTTVIVRPLPPKQKTIVQVAADAGGYAENKYREEFKVSCAFMDAIEQRLQAIEEKQK
jgi:hypothetical protein